MRLSWPLIGRTGPMRTIASSIAAPDVPGVVIFGAAGVGKSRIAREALAAAESQGLAARWVAGAVSARAIPLGALTAWTQVGGTDTVHLLRGVIAALTETSSGASVVIAVDDAHVLDDLSAFVVQQVVQKRAAKLILTVRDDEPIPDSIREIWKAAHFSRIHVPALSTDDTAALLAAALGAPVDREAAQRLWRLSLGNALYLRNIVEEAVAQGGLTNQQGIWRWNGDPDLPPDLIGLIEARIGALPEAVADVLDVLSVAEPLALTTLTEIADAEAVEEAETRNLITVDDTGIQLRVRVAHPLYAEVRRRRAPHTRLRRLRGLVATALAESADSDEIQLVVQRGALTLDSDLDPDVDLLVRAANGAVWLADLHLADRLASAATESGSGPEPGLIRAHALSWLGRGEDAEAVLAGLAAGDHDEAVRARIAFLRASNMLWALGDPERAKEIIDEASNVTSDQARGYIDAFLTVYWFALDQPATALQAAQDLTLEELPPVVGAEVAWVLTTLAAEAGHTARAESVAEVGYALAQASFDAPHMRFNIADSHVSALLLAGRIADALKVADRTREQAAELPGAAHLLGAAVAGRAALGAGRLDSAMSLFDDAVTGLTVSHPSGWGYRYLVPRATVLAMRGDSTGAAATLIALEERKRAFRSLDYERAIARAWAAAGQGAVSEAIAEVLSAAQNASAKGQLAAEVLCLQTATQFGDRRSAPRLTELASVVEGPRAGLAARFASALRDGDAAELGSVSEEFERMGDLIAAIDAAANAALLYRDQDRRGSALTCSARATALAERCGSPVTPALRQAADPLPLTDREREIVMLIGAGLSNRAVAERLTLSVRTVESHIYRAMAKTGTTRREELAGLLNQRPD